MKRAWMTLGAVALAGLAGPAIAQTGQAEQSGEIGYAEGSLGYDAIVDGEYKKAIEQIEADRTAAANDPAKLINLGHAHARMGDADAARRFYEAALAGRQFDLILADGRVMNSRRAAREALRGLRDESSAK